MTLKTIESIVCDGENCTHVREHDTNHWLVGFTDQGRVTLAINRDAIDHEPINDKLVKDFCGEECGIKWLSKMLTEIRK